MEIIKYNPDEHYKILVNWFNEHNWQPAAKELISPDSFFVFNNNIPLVFSGIYFTTTPLSFLSFTIANPKQRIKGDTDFLMNYLWEFAKEKNIKVITYFTDSKKMVNKLNDKHGFEITDNGTGYILVKRIDTTVALDFLI